MTPPVRRARLLLPVLAAGLAGCTLIDERTFNPDAERRPVFTAPAAAVAVTPEPGPKPLLTVRPPVSAAVLQADIARAVAAARSLKPSVVFDVVAVTEQASDPGADAATVAQMIVAQGVPATRVHLAARPIATGPAEVRVYVH